jgi:hypothetical protein
MLKHAGTQALSSSKESRHSRERSNDGAATPSCPCACFGYALPVATDGGRKDKPMASKDAVHISADARRPAVVTGATAGLTSEASPAAQPALAADLTRDLVKELSRRERLVLMLRYTEELTVAEIAAVLEIAVTEVERMLENIAERVRRRLQPMYGRPAQRLSRS